MCDGHTVYNYESTAIFAAWNKMRTATAMPIIVSRMLHSFYVIRADTVGSFH